MQTKEDLRALFAEHIHKLHSLLEKEESTTEYRLMHTSGTTNEPLPVVYTQRPDWNPVFLGKGSRVVMSFGAKPLRLDFAQAYADADTPDVDLLFLDAKTTPEEARDVLADFRPTTLVSPPTTLLRMTQQCAPSLCEKVLSIVLAGELLSTDADKLLQERFPNAEVVNTYAATEVGEIGVSCPRCQRNEFHPFDGVNLEIFNPDNEGVGDVLISKNNPGGIPLKKYRIGDVGMLQEHDGEKTIQLLGRRGFDYVKLADALLIRDEFDRVAQELERYIADYKAEVTTTESKGAPIHTITLFVALPSVLVGDRGEAAGVIAREFSKRLFVTPNSTLKMAVDKGIFHPLKVEVVERVVHETIKPQRLYVRNS